MDTNASELPIDSKIRFDNKATSWRVRAHTACGRYTIATASRFGEVLYTIIDWDEQIRGPLNIVGQGMGITTTAGPDDEIDETIAMLEEGLRDVAAAEADGCISSCHWEVSQRNRVRLRISDVRSVQLNT